MVLNSMHDKLKAFNFETVSVDGHSVSELDQTLNNLLNSKSSLPKAIIANTIKGKGVSFMESKNEWHYTRLTESTYQDALKELGY